ncbi:type II toxin-antitoxin system ParD family antitoxin [Asticcacaulis sp. EMRT-3]|uniref:ribbon-helix-helix domain-containing protein n=1 Tax=Asticcacaulis sp. EMRT-3 TaxID=3040349 RepID=UPI0024AF4C7F|nr:type II toxin-antitoxin system ParD family antitoxin [Asticcacaulis sp. EMRT-3]MDI7776429.1 type II toxin-antitoxin system ParD family antitoxin [Asticcacaulis sp. EMRT-3]
MRSTQQFSITVPNEMADMIRAKVRSGEYASESEVVRDGLRSLLARDRAMEKWIQDEVIPALDAYEANPDKVYTPDEVRAHLAERREARARQA